MRGQAGPRAAQVKALTAIRESSKSTFSAQKPEFSDLEMPRISERHGGVCLLVRVSTWGGHLDPATISSRTDPQL